MQLECYEILTNKNDVERRNGVIYKPLNMLNVNWLVVSIYIREKKRYIYIERERASRRGLPPITFVYHIYLRSFSFFFFFYVVEARRRKKGFVNWKKERKRKLTNSSNNRQSTQTFSSLFNLILLQRFFFFFSTSVCTEILNKIKEHGFSPFGQAFGR